MGEGKAATARAVALAGPYGAGKTSVFEALLFAAGAKDRLGRVDDATSAGDRSPEARARGLSTELNVAAFDYLGDRYTLIDLPGSVEFAAEAAPVLQAVDMTILVAEPDLNKIAALTPWLKALEAAGAPYTIFINKIDESRTRVRDLYDALAEVCPKPLAMRQIPIWEGERVTGFIDLALERAYVYRAGQASLEAPIPSDLADREADARFQLLETLADYDDALMENLLDEIEPDRSRVFADLTEDLRQGLIIPVFLGAAALGGGARRLLKALRHESPDVGQTARRLGIQAHTAEAIVQVLKTVHAGQAGKQSLVRVLSGAVKDGATYARSDGSTERGGGLAAPHVSGPSKIEAAKAGDVVFVGRLSDVGTGETLAVGGSPVSSLIRLERPAPVFARAIAAGDRKDEVKLSSALAKLVEEDLGLVVETDAEAHELRLLGQGDIHLRVAADRLKRAFGVSLTLAAPSTPYRETIRRGTVQRGRHKKQSGGHGQFGDVVIEVSPLARDEGFRFDERITGGVVPRTYFAAVEAGVRDGLRHGPLGFPVVDLAVALIDGSYHAVDSSEIAFRTAGRLAIAEALAACGSILLEPIMKVEAFAPSEFMSRVTSLLTARRAQIAGFDAREGWPGWDRVDAYLPLAETHELILELRSATQGLGTFEARFDHMAELTGRLADAAVKEAANAGA